MHAEEVDVVLTMVEKEFALRHGLYLIGKNQICNLSPSRATKICLAYLIGDKNSVATGRHFHLGQGNIIFLVIINGNVDVNLS